MSSSEHLKDTTVVRDTSQVDLSFAYVLALILNGRRLLSLFVLLGGLTGLAFALLRAPRYQSAAEFVAQENQSGLEGLSGLASQFGFRVPSLGSGLSPEFYRDLLTSRQVVERVIGASYARDSGGDALPLLDLMEIEGDTPQERAEEGADWFVEEALTATVKRETGVVSFAVTTKWRRVSQSIATELLAAMQDFNTSKRRTQARHEREFLQERLDSAGAELREAEGRLEGFLSENRSYENSASLVFRRERLSRDVTLRQEVFSGLTQAFEQARIEEVRSTPAITILESPSLPSRREPRGTVLYGLLGTLLAGAIGLAVVMGSAAFAREAAPDTMALAAAWKSTKSDIARIFRRKV